MKVAFDAKQTAHNVTGLGNCGRFIVNSLSISFPEHIYQLYTSGRGKGVLQKRIEERPSVSFHYSGDRFDRLFPSLWHTSGLTAMLRKEHVDLFHSLGNEILMNLKQNRTPTIVTIHDLIFLRYPQFYRPIDRPIYIYKFKQACLRSDKIIATSRQTMRDIRDFFHILESKIEVVYQGCDPIFDQAVQEDVESSIREKYQINGPYVLYVGSIRERKSLLLLIKALKKPKEGISVIAIGKHTPYIDTVEIYIRGNNLSGRVHILARISFNELAAFYWMMTLFAYPSSSEEFGIPILKAQLAGTLVIATTGSYLERTDEPSASYTDPRNEQELRGLIESVLSESKPVESMRSGGRENIQRSMPDVLAAHFMRICENISRS